MPSTVINAPRKPASLYPTRMDALMDIGPGEDWAMQIMSIIASSLIQPSFSTNRLRIKGTMTYPPPKVNALSVNVERNKVRKNFQSFFKTTPLKPLAPVRALPQQSAPVRNLSPLNAGKLLSRIIPLAER